MIKMKGREDYNYWLDIVHQRIVKEIFGFIPMVVSPACIALLHTGRKRQQKDVFYLIAHNVWKTRIQVGWQRLYDWIEQQKSWELESKPFYDRFLEDYLFLLFNTPLKLLLKRMHTNYDARFLWLESDCFY
jgi:hypothetical protein